MKKGWDRSVVLAPAGTTALDVTQAGWAMTAGTTEAVDINAPIRTVNAFFIFRLFPRATSLFSSSFKGDHVGRLTGGQAGAAPCADQGRRAGG